MATQKDCAFPLFDTALAFFSKGLSKREYFAGLALQGLLACPDATEKPLTYDQALNELPKAAVAYADRLLKELNRESGRS